jgi:hypothetical protein
MHNFSFFTWALRGLEKYAPIATPCLAIIHFFTLECLIKK